MMLQEIYKKICAGQELRASLIELKQQLKMEENQKAFRVICGNNYDVIMKCLIEEDPKIRKNAAAILGILRVQDSVDVLMDAYLEEETLFVRPEYVEALAGLDCEEYLEDFHRRADELSVYNAPEQEKKHVAAELHALQELILRKEGLKKHKFAGFERANDVVLTTLPAFRDVLAESVLSKKTLMKGGLRTITGNLRELLENRLWQEMLFVIHGEDYADHSLKEPKQVAQWLKASDLMEILTENHEGEAPFYFRVGVQGNLTKPEKSDLAKKTAQAIEEAFAGQMINSPSYYEIELRLMVRQSGDLGVYLKLFTLADHRFDYRRYSVAAGMKPVLAAGLLALASPYLKEYAQVLDPFCGVGTLLMERRFQGPVRNLYGIDLFGEAIEKARVNAKIAGFQANYINRNYFDFTHEYSFDEIITDMPTGFASRGETDAVYRRFFEKSAELLQENGRVILYSGEMGMVKKYLRIQNQYRLLKEYCILEKSGMYLFILEKK